MKATFGNLIETVSPLIEAGIPTLKELIRYLWRCFQNLRPQLTTATSFDDVIEFVQDKCTIINVCCLEAIVDHYKITGAKSHIEEFKTAIDTFCEKIKTDISLKQNFKIASLSQHLTCETIELCWSGRPTKTQLEISNTCYQKHLETWLSLYRLEQLMMATPSLLPAMLL